MLKMQDDPDESLKTKDNFSTGNSDPDDCLKTKDLYDNFGKAEKLLKSKRLTWKSATESHARACRLRNSA